MADDLGFWQPHPDVNYRIRNVDFGTFLERRWIDDQDELVLRPEKNNIAQYWIFERQIRGKVWIIKAALDTNNSNDLDARVVAADKNNKIISFNGPREGYPNNWELLGGPGHLLSGRHTYILVDMQGGPWLMGADGKTGALGLATAGLQNANALRRRVLRDSYIWELIEVNDAHLPTGTNANYRIRTLNGQALEIDSLNKVKLQPQDMNSRNRQWTLKVSPGNGRYTIQNAGTGKYLGTEQRPTSTTWVVSPQDSAAVWNIYPTGVYTYWIWVERQIIINRDPAPQELSLCIDRGMAILKPKKIAHNQIWILEPEGTTNQKPEHNEDLLNHLLALNARWAKGVVAGKPDFFKSSALAQNPSVLWFGCADSRVPESVITESMPGEIFVHRNIANQLPIGDSNAFSILEFAVGHLKVSHVVVVGHTNCGGANASLSAALAGRVATETIPNLAANNFLNKWLAPLTDLAISFRPKLASLPNDLALQTFIEKNIKRQVETIVQSAVVQNAWKEAAQGTRNQLKVHGWIYELGTGLLRDLDVSRG